MKTPPHMLTLGLVRAVLLTLMLVSLVACKETPTPTPLPTPTLPALPPGDVATTMSFGGLERRYELHVPPSYTGTPVPLVVVLHGGGPSQEDVKIMKEVTGFDAKADAAGFLVVYPVAIEDAWNDGRGVTKYRSHRESIDDVGFITALVDRIASMTPIDRARVYVTGASNGGMMSYRLACDRPDRFAAVAAVIANVPTRLVCAPGHTVPVLVMNGTDDPMMPYEGGHVHFGSEQLGEVLSTDQTVAKWVQMNGCSSTPSTESLPNRAPLDGTRLIGAPCRLSRLIRGDALSR